MSTRATLSIRDGRDVYHIYRHHDGYPDGKHGVIAGFIRAEKLSWSQPRFEAGDVAAAVVAAMKTEPGSVYLTKDADLHADRNFHYDLMPGRDAIGGQVKEFSWRTEKAILRFQGTLPEAAIEFGVVDSLKPATDAQTRADLMALPGFSELTTDSCGNPNVWQNFYDCSCGCSWDDYWSCQVDDDCPRCETTISPTESFWHGPSEQYELWERLPEAGAEGMV